MTVKIVCTFLTTHFHITAALVSIDAFLFAVFPQNLSKIFVTSFLKKLFWKLKSERIEIFVDSFVDLVFG
jgi:hypothetical protein